jgi:hypothetical protein
VATTSPAVWQRTLPAGETPTPTARSDPGELAPRLREVSSGAHNPCPTDQGRRRGAAPCRELVRQCSPAASESAAAGCPGRTRAPFNRSIRTKGSATTPPLTRLLRRGHRTGCPAPGAVGHTQSCRGWSTGTAREGGGPNLRSRPARRTTSRDPGRRPRRTAARLERAGWLRSQPLS